MFCRLLSIAEEALGEFLSKAKGTAVDWVQIPGMKVFFFPLYSSVYIHTCGVQVCCNTFIQTLGFTYQINVFHYPCRTDSYLVLVSLLSPAWSGFGRDCCHFP